jgi:5'(3')-deoxyribonucleotidase
MSIKRLLIDCDGVLASFTDGFLAIANRIAGTHYAHDDVDAWNLDELPGVAEHSDEIWAEVGEPGFARNLVVYPGAQAGVAALSRLGEVRVVTAPLWMNNEDEKRGPFQQIGSRLESLYGKTFCWDRMKWLQEHFQIPRKHIIFAYDKSGEDGDVLIDDKVENIQNWIDRHGSRKGRAAILWAQKYNAYADGAHPKVIRTNDWARAAEIVRGL